MLVVLSVASLSLCSHYYPLLLFLLGFLASAMLGLSCYISLAITMSPRHKSSLPVPKCLDDFQSDLIKSLAEDLEKSQTEPQDVAPVISRNVDQEINEVIDILTQQYVSSWLSNLVNNLDVTEVKMLIKRDAWTAIASLSDRLSRIDHVRLLASDMVRKVTDHFERIRLLLQQQQCDQEDQDVVATDFKIHPHLVSRDRELDFLGKIAELIVAFLLPPSYSRCPATRTILRDVLAHHVLFFAIDTLTDPDFINRSILAFLDEDKHHTTSVLLQEQHRQGLPKLEAFMHANSYQDFLSAISTSMDVDALKQIRFNILAEIVQATTLDNLSSAKISNESSSSDTRLRNYVSQLVKAKTVCEKRLGELGCDPYSTNTKDMVDHNHHDIDVERKSNLSFKAIMNSAFTRRYFYTYLEPRGQQDLLGLWAAVEELKEADRTLWHQLATEIFYTYISRGPSKSNNNIRVSKAALKRIEAFLMGDSGPQVFYEIQEDVLRTLEAVHYPAFLVSDTCYKMLEDAHERGVVISETAKTQEDDNNIEEDNNTTPMNGSDTESAILEEEEEEIVKQEAEKKGFAENHSTYAKSQLEHVGERLQNKMQALKALKSSLKPDSKVLKMLQGEVEGLQMDHSHVEQHLLRTEAWAEHLGRWRCHVQSVEHVEDQDVLRAVLVVHVPMRRDEAKRMMVKRQQQQPPSWVCTRQLNEFHSLHRDLLPYVTWVKDMVLPAANSGRSSLISFRGSGNSGSSNSTSSLSGSSQPSCGNINLESRYNEKARSVLQRYIDAILSDDKLSSSEIIYSFLSPSPKHLKTLSSRGENSSSSSSGKMLRQQPKRYCSSSSSSSSNFNSKDQEQQKFFSFFKSGDSSPPSIYENYHFDKDPNDPNDEEGERFLLNDFDARDGAANNSSGQDGVAEPLYALIGEVFDMRGVFKILRKSLMTFVQITYGSTISRQLRDTVAWATSEHMVIKAVRGVKTAFKNHDDAKGIGTTTTTIDRKEAREAVLRHIPDVLVNLVGQQAARNGMAKVLDTLQDKTLNKQLAYDMLELLSYTIFPELVQSYAVQQFKNNFSL